MKCVIYGAGYMGQYIDMDVFNIADITLIHDEPIEDKLQPEIYINIVKKGIFYSANI